MNYFVIGDVHGCFNTLEKMIADYWNPNSEILIQVGDLIDRGKHAPQCVQLVRNLEDEYPGQTRFIKGNHEAMLLEHISNPPNFNWLRQGGQQTLDQYEASGRNLENDIAWIDALPLFYDSEHLFVSHAGIARNTTDPFDEENPDGILWNRGQLKNLGKLQLVGHTPFKEAVYDQTGHAYYIDTGAAYSGHLTGIKISAGGEPLELYSLKTDSRDI